MINISVAMSPSCTGIPSGYFALIRLHVSGTVKRTSLFEGFHETIMGDDIPGYSCIYKFHAATP